ncbi:hypothetical protein CG723_28800 [Streptomyces sp. CB01635]|nr:hypothetical protein CG723_28800 [Streptomyces sp. CB01635]
MKDPMTTVPCTVNQWSVPLRELLCPAAWYGARRFTEAGAGTTAGPSHAQTPRAARGAALPREGGVMAAFCRLPAYVRQLCGPRQGVTQMTCAFVKGRAGSAARRQ